MVVKEDAGNTKQERIKGMIRYLMKNNLKLMFRNKWILLIMILGPIGVTAILSSAMESLMESYSGVGEFSVGYRLEEEGVYSEYMETIKEAGKEMKMDFVEYPSGEPEELLRDYDLAAFVELGDEQYTIYEAEDNQIEAITLEYFLNRVQEEGMNRMWEMETESVSAVSLPVKQIDYMPAINAKDYYGIIYIVYFSWCCLICIANVLGNEKKCGIENKFRVTGISGVRLYMAKWIPTVLVTAAGMAVATIVSTVLYQIHWGNLMIFAGILLLSIMASSSFGLMLYYLFHHMAIAIIALFSSVWIMGFFGGSFATYMFSGWAENVKDYSPIYHINRALVENSCMGHSDYTIRAVLFSVAIAVICSVIAILADGIRKRGRA